MSDARGTFLSGYTALVPEPDVLAAMDAQLVDTLALLRGIAEDESGRPHPPYTWTLRQVVGHLIDTERIFGYRALRIARADATPLPGFDEQSYADAGEFDRRSLRDLAEEFEAVRRGHLLMFRHLPTEGWTRRGTVNGDEVGVRELCVAIVGHVRHHARIVRKRLMSTAGLTSREV